MTQTEGGAASPPNVHVSVVLCTWNGARWLPDLLDSLARQHHLPDQLVVQDDASTDGSVELVAAWADGVPFPVEIEVNAERLGSTRNFERALARSRGQIVALADQDDLWYPEKLARLAEVLDEDPILTLTFSDADLLDEQGRPLGRSLWSSRGTARFLAGHEVVPGPMFARRALSTGCTMAVRRRAVEAALPFPDALDDPEAPMRHDRWLSLVAAAVGTVRALPDRLLGFRVHPAQQTGVLTSRQLADRLRQAAAAAATGPDATLAREHQARARQIDEAALRADRLGDFDEADALRRVAEHHRVRADLGATFARRLRTIGREVADDGYDRSLFGAAAAAADAVRALHPALPDERP